MLVNTKKYLYLFKSKSCIFQYYFLNCKICCILFVDFVNLLENKKIMLKKLVFLFLFPVILVLQSCTTIQNKNYAIQNKIEGRFSLTLSQHSQSTQGRFLWLISTKNNSIIEEFYLMDPWGKTLGILMRNIEIKKSPWVLLNPNHKLIKKKYIETWLKKELELPDVDFAVLTSPISVASTKMKQYFQKGNKNTLIKVESDTNLGKVTINLLPDK